MLYHLIDLVAAASAVFRIIDEDNLPTAVKTAVEGKSSISSGAVKTGLRSLIRWLRRAAVRRDRYGGGCISDGSVPYGKSSNRLPVHIAKVRAAGSGSRDSSVRCF